MPEADISEGKTLLCMLACSQTQEHPEPCSKNMWLVFLSAWRADAIKQAKAVLQGLSAPCTAPPVPAGGCAVPCYCKDPWSKVCLSNAIPVTYKNYNHVHIQTSPVVLRKGKKKSQQQAYPSLTLSHRDNQFTGAGTPPNAAVILFLAA